MCGIAGVHRRTARPIPKLDQLCNELLMGILPRGTDATGFLSLMDDGKVQLQKEPKRADAFIADRGRIHKDARTVLLHTRFATVGSKHDPKNAHPVASGKVAAIHNGTINNADQLFASNKLPRIGRVDSEIIPALVNKGGWEDGQVVDALSKLRGSAATAIIHTEHPKDVVLARVRNYPLVYIATRDLVIWASTAQAIKRAWQATYGKPLTAKLVTLAEGQAIRVNGKIVAMPRIETFEPVPVRPWSDAATRAACAPKRSAPKRKKARGGKGMPRAFPKEQTFIPSEALAGNVWWDDADIARYQDDATELIDVEDMLTDLMANGLSRHESLTIIADAASFRPQY